MRPLFLFFLFFALLFCFKVQARVMWSLLCMSFFLAPFGTLAAEAPPRIHKRAERRWSQREREILPPWIQISCKTSLKVPKTPPPQLSLFSHQLYMIQQNWSPSDFLWRSLESLADGGRSWSKLGGGWTFWIGEATVGSFNVTEGPEQQQTDGVFGWHDA